MIELEMEVRRAPFWWSLHHDTTHGFVYIYEIVTQGFGTEKWNRRVMYDISVQYIGMWEMLYVEKTRARWGFLYIEDELTMADILFNRGSKFDTDILSSLDNISSPLPSEICTDQHLITVSFSFRRWSPLQVVTSWTPSLSLAWSSTPILSINYYPLQKTIKWKSCDHHIEIFRTSIGETVTESLSKEDDSLLALFIRLLCLLHQFMETFPSHIIGLGWWRAMSVFYDIIGVEGGRAPGCVWGSIFPPFFWESETWKLYAQPLHDRVETLVQGGGKLKTPEISQKFLYKCCVFSIFIGNFFCRKIWFLQ